MTQITLEFAAEICVGQMKSGPDRYAAGHDRSHDAQQQRQDGSCEIITGIKDSNQENNQSTSWLLTIEILVETLTYGTKRLD